MKKHFVHSLMGHLIEAARLLLDVSCFCADIYYMVPFIMVQHFVHSHYISVKSMNYALCDLQCVIFFDIIGNQ